MTHAKLCITSFFLLSFLLPAAGVLAGEENFDRAIELFSTMEYREAEPYFIKALDSGKLTDAQVITVRESLAESYIALGQNADAIEQYTQLLLSDRSYALSSEASPPMLKAYKDARAKLPAPVIAIEHHEETPPLRTHSGIKRRAAWFCTGVATVGLGTGIVFYSRSQDYHDKYTDTDDEDEAEDYREAGQAGQTISQVGFAVGLVSGAAATYFFLSDDTSGKSSRLGKFDIVYARDGDMNQAAILYRW